jgi:hypothetical protein
MRPYLGKTVLGGFIGTIAMTMMMYWVGPLMGLMKMDIAQGLGSMLGVGWAEGMIMHFMNGSLIFPAIYAFLLYRLLPGKPVVKGMIWGAILWLMAQLIVMPMMGGGVFSSNRGGTMAAAASLMGHLVYGAILGAVGGWASAPAAGPRAAFSA